MREHVVYGGLYPALLSVSGVLGCVGAFRGECPMTPQGSHAGVNLHSSEGT